MSRRKRRSVNATGRNDGEGQYAILSYALLQSHAWRNLSGAAVKVWLEVRARYNGSNNGKLTLSGDEAARILHIGKATVMRALTELQAKGFLVMKERGRWYGRQATTWRVTEKPCDGHPATNDWKRWRPPEKQSLGSNTDRKNTPMGPLENRSPPHRSAAEPVRAF
jgi:hypothetical protein